MYRVLTALRHGARDLVFAPTCVCCTGPIPTTAADRMVCIACWTRMRPLPGPRCDRCWTPLPRSGAALSGCRECPSLRPAVRALRAAYLHDGPVRRLVHALKYRGWYGVARTIAARMSTLSFPAEVESELDLVVAVPLAPVRRRQRGYNQAELLASGLASAKRLKHAEGALERARTAGSQTTLHPDERRANVAGAFRVAPRTAGSVTAAHILLVDDVWTTGATALACADALLDGGARAVSIMTFARALPELERLNRRIAAAGTF